MTDQAPRYILRVDDVGQALDQSKRDKELEYFRKWWGFGEFGNLPVYLGVVPAALGEFEKNYLLELESRTGARICLHGWDHSRQPLAPEHLILALDAFPNSRCVIPPYNLYDNTLLASMELLRSDDNWTLFGGFDGQDHRYGLEPIDVRSNIPQGVTRDRSAGRIVHLSVDPNLYDRAYILASRNSLPQCDWPPRYDWPTVVTLHHRWDCNSMNGVTKLIERIGPNLVTVEEAHEYADRSREAGSQVTKVAEREAE